MVSLGDNKYQKGKIYFIGNYVDDDIYIGSTTQTLKEDLTNIKYKLTMIRQNIENCMLK